MQNKLPRQKFFYLPTSKYKFAALLSFLVCICFYSLGNGAVPITAPQTLAIVLQNAGVHTGVEYPPHYEIILYSIRLPRILLAILVGACLSAAGAALQALFRNPLADPGLIGVSSGAAAATAAAIVFGGFLFGEQSHPYQSHLLPLSAFAGGLVTVFIIYQIGSVNGHTSVATMLLAGIAINAVASAIIGLLIFLSNDQQIRDITFWMMGSLSRNTLAGILPTLPFFLTPLILLPQLAKQLNIMALGESSAANIGVNTERVKLWVILLASLAVGASVALTGIIAFVGLVVPHLTRFIMGPDNRSLIPASMLVGAILLVIADNLARTLVVPAELPIGIITSCIGGPFFLWLLIKKRNLMGQS